MGKYLNMIRQAEKIHEQTGEDQEPNRCQSDTVETPPPVPGSRITWQVGVCGKMKEGVVDFVHTYPGGVWAFCTRPDDGWVAVNTKYVSIKEDPHA